MLQLILGRTGSGKTDTLLKQLAAAARKSTCADGCLLLVPEQFSYETERLLLQWLDAQTLSKVKVYSFTRLAEMILRRTGHFAGHRLNEAARAMLVSQALSETEAERKLPRRSVDSGQVTAVARMLTELKQCAVTAEELTEQASRESGTLSDKLNDLALIYDAYDALVERSYIDPQDALTKAASFLPTDDFARGAQVFVDGFTGFTAQEMKLLSALMERAEQVTVALCTDSLDDREEGLGLFSIPTATAQELERLAKERGVLIAAPIRLTENYRHRTAGLRTLEAELYRPDGQPFDEKVSDVKVVCCTDIYGECAMLVRAIRRYLREGGRGRDVAIVARDLAPYRGVLDVALTRAGIPCFLDAGESFLNDALARTALSAVRAVTEGWQTEDILRLLKTGLLGFSSHSVSMIEDYVYVWNLSGSKFREEWEKHPDGFAGEMTSQDKASLAYLNLLRRRLIKPLEALYCKLREPLTARDFSAAIYEYLKDVKVDRLTKLRVAQWEQAGEPAQADRTERSWNAMMELLDTFAAAGAAATRPAKVWSGLFHMVAGMAEIDSIPTSVDAVQIGAADRVRLSSPKRVFVIGVNEDVFPAVPPTGGYFTERERTYLLKEKLPLAQGADWQANQERFFAYAAVTAPSEQLCISYVCGDLKGAVAMPSSLVYAVRRLLPKVKTENFGTADVAEMETPEEAMDYLAATFTHPTPQTATLSEALAERADYAEKLRGMERSAHRKAWEIADPAVARRLFGHKMLLYYSAVEAFYQCPFRYFCQYGLRVKPPQKAEWSSLSFGTAIHYLLEKVLPLYMKQGIQTVTEEQIARDAAEWLDRYVQEELGGAETLPARFFYLLSRLKMLGQQFLAFIVQEQKQSEFHPVDYELSIDDSGTPDSVPCLRLTLDDGTQIAVTGKVDRVDACGQNGQTYLRVVDYKTGKKSKTFELDEVVEGLNLQMLIYLFTLCENGGKRYDNPRPAGVLYFPAVWPGKDAAKIDGLLLNNDDVLAKMATTPEGQKLLPKNTKPKNAAEPIVNHRVTVEQLERLRRKMERLLCEMAQTLQAGHVEAKPFADGDYSPCTYCDYHDVCGHEFGDPERTAVKGRRELVLSGEEEA